MTRLSFVRKCFTDREQEAIARKGSQTAAGYFAAKEAVTKALGTGFASTPPTDIEITNDERGKPAATVKGFGGLVHVSISHDGGFAVAFAVAEGKTSGLCPIALRPRGSAPNPAKGASPL